MDIDSLSERLNYSLRKNEVLQLAQFFSTHPMGVDTLFEISLSGSGGLAFHAAWVLESCLMENPHLLDKNAHRLLTHIPDLKNNSVRRHFCKLFKTWMVKHHMETCSWFSPQSADAETLIEVCYDWLLSSDVPVSVKAHCLEILQVLSLYHPWIAEELPNTIRLIQIDSSAGIKAMVRRITRDKNG